MSLAPDGREWMSDREGEREQRSDGDPWVCFWCLLGQHAACTSGVKCDCNAGRGDNWGHLKR